MITVRASEARGNADHGWLRSKHSFSFGSYFDPAYVGFGPLRVINEDRVVPGAGFGTHGHRDMEIVSYVLDGALEHKDNTGSGSVIRPGEIQRMTAGRGILHSEYNHSKQDPVHFLQIWINPSQKGLEPGYEQKAFEAADAANQLQLIASPEGSGSAVKIHQDANIYVSRLGAGNNMNFSIDDNRQAWIQLARGEVSVNDTSLREGDGAAIVNEAKLSITALQDAEILLFDLPVDE